MVSLQSSLFPWFTFDRELPETNKFIPAWYDKESSYEVPNLEKKQDEKVKKELSKNNLFVSAYFHSEFQFSSDDNYSLFIPLDCSIIQLTLDTFSSLGKSYQDRLIREEAKIMIEEILKSHMVEYKIYPSQIQERDCTIETKHGILFINKDGYLNKTDNQILKYMEFPHASLFFISREIQ